MGQVLHGCATTTEAIRRAIQHSQESLRTLSRRYSINPKTVAKWKKRGSVADLPTGPKEAKSTVLSVEDEARDFLAHVVALRVDRGPPFCAALALWLSRIATVGEALRPETSRTCAYNA